MVNWIKPASELPFNPGASNLPNVGEALIEWFQPMTFKLVTKTVVNFQADEKSQDFSFMGTMQPLSYREIMIKPEGQRAWTWWWLHADPSLLLNVDDVVNYSGKNYRVMGLKPYDNYGYREYHLIEDYTGSDPVVEAP